MIEVNISIMYPREKVLIRVVHYLVQYSQSVSIPACLDSGAMSGLIRTSYFHIALKELSVDFREVHLYMSLFVSDAND